MDLAISQAELPVSAFHTKRAYIPQLRQLAFVDHVARESGLAEMALTLGPNASITEYGIFGDYVTSPETFGGALRLTTAMMSYHSSFDRMSLVPLDDDIKFNYHAAVRHAIGYRHYAILAICVLSTIALPYFGRKDVAKRIEFDFARPPDCDAFETFFKCAIHFDKPSLCLVYGRDQLSQRRLAEPHRTVSISDVVRDAMNPAPREVFGAVEALVRLGIEDGDTSLNSIACQLDCGERTLRRRLDAFGISYRDLVLKTRIDRARELLTQTKLPVTQIAMEVGYSDNAHFTRAFRGLTGMSPREARRIRK